MATMEEEKWAWSCLFLTFVVWFIPDTALSIYTGVILNAICNTVILVMVFVPLAIIRKEVVARNSP